MWTLRFCRRTANWISTSPKAATRPVCSQRPSGRQGGHEQLDGPGGVHSSADDLLGLLQGPQPQRQIGVGPGHDLVDQPGAEHEDVAGDFRPFGRFLHRGDERAGPEHERGSPVRVGKTSILGGRQRHWQGDVAGGIPEAPISNLESEISNLKSQIHLLFRRHAAKPHATAAARRPSVAGSGTLETTSCSAVGPDRKESV